MTTKRVEQHSLTDTLSWITTVSASSYLDNTNINSFFTSVLNIFLLINNLFSIILLLIKQFRLKTVVNSFISKRRYYYFGSPCWNPHLAKAGTCLCEVDKIWPTLQRWLPDLPLRNPFDWNGVEFIWRKNLIFYCCSSAKNFAWLKFCFLQFLGKKFL